MTALPPTYYLHVWWARRPLVASRAAILASLLPAHADRGDFLHAIGIHGDPVAMKKRIDEANRAGEKLEANPYGYARAFQYVPSELDRNYIQTGTNANPASKTVLDPTAGGGSIPFEASRLGVSTLANDLNPVAALLLLATVSYPSKFGLSAAKEFQQLSARFIGQAAGPYQGIFPAEPEGTQVLGYIYARTVRCPHCDGLVPLSPNWRVASDGTGVRLVPQMRGGPMSAGRVCKFEIVYAVGDDSDGTVSGGDATCPYPDCRRVVDSEEIKRQAQAGGMGEQLYMVAIRSRVQVSQISGKPKFKWKRSFRAPCLEDDNSSIIQERLADKLPEWLASDILPNERFPEGTNDDRPLQYGMPFWRDMFSPRQLLCHGISVEIYRAMLEEDRLSGKLTELRKAAYVYLALSLDTTLNYGNRSCRWDSVTLRVRSIFDRHDFAFCWSYAEMAFLGTGLGYEWANDKTAKCIEELADLVRGDDPKNTAIKKQENIGLPFPVAPDGTPELPAYVPPPDDDYLQERRSARPHSRRHSGRSRDGSALLRQRNVCRTLGLFSTCGSSEPLATSTEIWEHSSAATLTDKEHEAVANPARFKGQKGAKALAGRDYQERMAGIFAECRRVLKKDGILTLMFTHKATGAWDALTKGLMAAGFIITASWPVNTEAEGSLHIKDKSAANSTILLVCRPRGERALDSEIHYWEDVEVEVAKAVRQRVGEFQEAGITGVDLYLASFGPALEKFSEYWPLQRGTPRPEEDTKKRKKQAALFEEEVDPYAVTPEDALTAARREVKQWRLEQLTHKKSLADMDPITAWFVLAWDAFKASTFPYDEGLRLARAVGVDLERDIVGHLAKKKASDLVLFDSKERATQTLDAADGSRAMIDALHFAAYTIRTKNTEAAREVLERNGLLDDPAFHSALQAVLEVLPVSKNFTKIDVPKNAEGASSDFEALESLRKLAFTEHVQEPEQLKLALKPAVETGAPEAPAGPGGTATLL
jgi:putative DNA methylase